MTVSSRAAAMPGTACLRPRTLRRATRMVPGGGRRCRQVTRSLSSSSHEDEGSRAEKTAASWADQNDWMKVMDLELEPHVRASSWMTEQMHLCEKTQWCGS